MSTSHYDQLCNVWQNTWESDSRRPRQSPALDNEELFVVEGSQKIIALKTGTRRPSGRSPKNGAKCA